MSIQATDSFDCSFLLELGFSEEEAKQAELDLDIKISLCIIPNARELIAKNILFLKDLGIAEYKSLFFYFPTFFFLDSAYFQRTFFEYGDRHELLSAVTKDLVMGKV